MESNNRILIVDDDPMIRDEYEFILGAESLVTTLTENLDTIDISSPINITPETQTFRLTCADEGESAANYIEKAINENQPFAAAFVDMKMPGMNGAETAKRLWAIDERVKIVIVTAFNEISPDEIVKIVGRDDIYFLRKPFHVEEIKQFARSFTQQWALEREQERLQNNLEKINATLEEMVMKRTAELRNAHNMLKKQDQEKFNFIRYISHEINTPLNYICAKELIDVERLADEEKQFMELIDKGYNRLNNLVKSALHYFSIADVNFQLKRTRVSLKEIINYLVSSKNNLISKQNLKFDINLGGIDVFNADPQYMEMLLNILIDNAIHFSNEGGLISVVGEVKGDSKQLRIIDEGKGIEKDDLTDIFVPFTIEEHKRHRGGYGFNLPIAKHICEVHGWDIWAKSAGLDKGAAFIINFKSEEAQKRKYDSF